MSLVLGMLMGGAEGGKAKTAQRLTGFQDPYLGPQWHVIKSNAAVMVKIKCVASCGCFAGLVVFLGARLSLTRCTLLQGAVRRDRGAADEGGLGEV